MCKHPYEARWPHRIECPNLGKKERPARGMRSSASDVETISTVPIRVKYNPWYDFDSLAHFWAQWYKEYLEADYPRLIVRFEDLQFHAKDTLDIICQCAGAVTKQKAGIFQYIVDSAKWGAAHKDRSSNMVTAMIKYGTDKNRFKGFRPEDEIVASSVLTPELLELFGYEVPEFSKIQ